MTAEDAWQGFRPSPGRIRTVTWPAGPGIRVDSHVTDDYLFPPYYDSLLAKLVVRAHDRDAAVDAMAAAVGCTTVDGVSTTLDFLGWLLAHPDFRRGGVTTQWLDRTWPAVAAAGDHLVAGAA